MLKNLDAFAELYGETNHISADNLKAILEDRAEAFIPNRAEAFIPNDIENQRALWCIARLRRRTKAMLHAARTLQDAKTPRQTEQRAMLYHWLCGVWLYHFGGELTYDRSGGDLGGEPGGPLVDFILTAMRQVMPEDALPSRETVRDNIDRERGSARGCPATCGCSNSDEIAVWGIDPPKTIVKPQLRRSAFSDILPPRIVSLDGGQQMASKEQGKGKRPPHGVPSP